MSGLLTKDELRELTGYVLPSYQIAWLKSHGYVFEVNSRGHPVLTWHAVNHINGLASKPSQFNFDAIP